MNTKKYFQLFILTAMLIASFATTSSAFAAGCGSSVTVASGDTLYKIAKRCGTNVSALRRANPEIGTGSLIYPGQSIRLPGTILGTDGGYFIYIVDQGDTLKGLAIRFATTVDALLAANPDITNSNVIYEGQYVKVVVDAAPTPPPNVPPPPPPSQVYYVRRGDTLRSIASRLSTTTYELLKANPQIWNPNLIYAGQPLTIPASASSYIVQNGDTLRIIAGKFGTTVDALLQLNPNVTNQNLIYVGQVINIR